MKGCATLFFVAVLVFFLLGTCSTGGTDDCIANGEPGSAQYDRDVQHCIKQDR